MFALFRNKEHSIIWYYRFRYLVLEIPFPMAVTTCVASSVRKMACWKTSIL